MTTNQSNSDNPRLNLEYRKKKRRRYEDASYLFCNDVVFNTNCFLRFIKSLADGTLCR